MRNEMTKGREKSDDRVVPESRRKAALTAKKQGGKAVTASEQTRQLRMNLGTADSPKGDDARAEAGQPAQQLAPVPKPRSRKRGVVPAMTMLGSKTEDCMRQVYKGHQSLWALSHNVAVEQGLRNAYFAERGLTSVFERWTAWNRSIGIASAQLTLPWR